jgi:hypothetical protein
MTHYYTTKSTLNDGKEMCSYTGTFNENTNVNSKYTEWSLLNPDVHRKEHIVDEDVNPFCKTSDYINGYNTNFTDNPDGSTTYTQGTNEYKIYSVGEEYKESQGDLPGPYLDELYVMQRSKFRPGTVYSWYRNNTAKNRTVRLTDKHKCIIDKAMTTISSDGSKPYISYNYNNYIIIIKDISKIDGTKKQLLEYNPCYTEGDSIDAYDIISDKNEIVKSKSQLNDSYANNIENNSYNLNKLNHKLSLINSNIKVQQDNYKLKNRATVILIFFIFVIIVGGIVGVVAYSYYYKKQTLKMGDFTNKFNNTFSNAINNSTNFMSNIVINNKNLNNNSNLHNNSNLL